jgi:hypothetical protein
LVSRESQQKIRKGEEEKKVFIPLGTALRRPRASSVHRKWVSAATRKTPATYTHSPLYQAFSDSVLLIAPLAFAG